MTLDSQGGKQPSPIAKERRARSITISNTKVESQWSKESSSNEAKHDVLDQEALLDFTHPMLRRVCPMTCRESRHQTNSESQRQAATSQTSCLLQGKVGKRENSATDKPVPPPRNLGMTAIHKPKSDTRQQQDFLPSGATGTQTSLSESEGIRFAGVAERESQSVFDGLTAQSSLSLHRKCTDYPQSRTEGFACNDRSYERVYSERSTALPVTPKLSFSTEALLNQSTVSPSVKTRRRQFGLTDTTKVDADFLSGPQEENNKQTITGTSLKLLQQTSVSQHTKSPQKQRLWSKAQSQTTQRDVKSAASQPDCVWKDYSCQSRDIDQKMEAPQCAHRSNQFKTCLVGSHTLEASSAAVECTTSKTTFSRPDITSHKQQLEHKQPPGPNQSHKEVNRSDTVLNPSDIVAASDRHGAPTKPPEYPSEKCVVSWPPSVAHCPFNTNSFGLSSKGVFDLPSQPQHRVYQRPDETTTASLPLQKPNYSPADRAFIMEEPEDPYYVTMYYPGSVYVGEYTDIQTTWKIFAEQIPQSRYMTGLFPLSF